MIDFKRIPKDGARFEALVCELLVKMGYIILQGPAAGSDGGKDILIERRLADQIRETRERVVVQCKHTAHGGRAVGEGDLGVWTNALIRCNALGYLLVTSTRITDNLSSAFAEYTKNHSPGWATCWSGDKLEVLLVGQPELLDIFFPPVTPHLRGGLGGCGIGLVFPEAYDARSAEEALRPLLELRTDELRESGGTGEIRRFAGSEGVRAGETALNWLARQGVGPGTPDPSRVPQFLILFGEPSDITFEFQTHLAIQYYVGRLPYTAKDELRRYAEAVVRAEELDPIETPSINFIAPTNGSDRATLRTSTELVVPVMEELRRRIPGGRIGQLIGAEATKGRMLSGMCEQEFALSFLAGHGIAVEQDRENLRELQGARVTADWTGDGRPLSEEICLIRAADFGDQIDLTSRVFIFFGCYGAGVTSIEYDRFESRVDAYRDPFVSALPRRLLSLGALGVIGHVGRAWTTAFSWVPEKPQPHTFVALLESILQGERLGVALQVLSKRYAELGAALDATERVVGEDQLVSRLRLAMFDARYNVLLGDPCCRIRLRS